MKNTIMFLLFLIIILASLHPSGNIETSYEYVNLGAMQIIIGKEEYELLLPYEKPYGVLKVPTKDQTGLIIHELLVDGKVIKPKKKFFSTNEAIDRLYEEDVNVKMENRTLRFLLWALGTKTDIAKIKKGLFYETVIGKTITPEQYVIPYGSKQVYLKYSIQYPLTVTKNIDRDIYLDKQYIVKWVIEWPEM